MNALMLALMTWISSTAGLPMPEKPPRLSWLPEEEMARLAGGGADAKAETAVASRYVALYHARSATIMLRTDWDRAELRDLSILVHELVHHMQAHAGRTYRCRGERERIAYDVQARWLERRGASLFEVMGLNGLFFHALTRC